MGQGLQRSGVAMRKHQKLVRIDRQAPMTTAVAEQQPVYPVHPEARSLVAGFGLPEGDIVLPLQILVAAIPGVIIDDQKMIDAHLTIVVKKEGQPDTLIAQCNEAEKTVRLDQAGLRPYRHDLSAPPDCPAEIPLSDRA